ncbi:MAG: SMR family transporter [Candidatus Marinamargulisbacteria bacterium]
MNLILILALAIRVFMDICFKLAVKNVSFQSHNFVAGFRLVFSHWAFWMALVVSAINFFLWVMVLSHFDLSFAYPLFGICFACIMVSGRLFFGESLDRNKMIGIGFILLSSVVLIFG